MRVIGRVIQQSHITRYDISLGRESYTIPTGLSSSHLFPSFNIINHWPRKYSFLPYVSYIHGTNLYTCLLDHRFNGMSNLTPSTRLFLRVCADVNWNVRCQYLQIMWNILMCYLIFASNTKMFFLTNKCRCYDLSIKKKGWMLIDTSNLLNVILC